MIKIGCCGFAKGKKEYFKHFKLVEIQQTFYRILPENTLEKWRQEAPDDFEFSVKAFQGISHPVSSPTWRRSGLELRGDERYGNLQPSKEVMESWEITRRVCDILKARICIIQLPKRFKDSEENIKNATEFFSNIDRGDLEIAVELRGWKDENVERLCREFDLIDCRDPFASRPTCFGKKNIAYLRLHGSPPGARMYNYRYTDKDLQVLLDIVREMRVRESYILFNNIYMFDDALRFRKLVEQSNPIITP